MKLYNVPKGSYIRVADTLELFFYHIDGAYSYCKDRIGQIYNIGASTDVEVISKPSDWEE